MRELTHNQVPPSSAPSEPVAAQLMGRVVAAVGVVVGVVLYLVVGPLIALGTGFLGFVAEIRDGVTRPRPFRGARHGFPFLDRRPPEREFSQNAQDDPEMPT